jgi:hypothetical protein
VPGKKGEKGKKLVRLGSGAFMKPPAKTARHRRLFRKLVELRSDFEHCHGCRRGFYHGEPAAVGYDPTGRVVMVGECCATGLARIIAVAVYFSPDPPA